MGNSNDTQATTEELDRKAAKFADEVATPAKVGMGAKDLGRSKQKRDHSQGRPAPTRPTY